MKSEWQLKRHDEIWGNRSKLKLKMIKRERKLKKKKIVWDAKGDLSATRKISRHGDIVMNRDHKEWTKLALLVTTLIFIFCGSRPKPYAMHDPNVTFLLGYGRYSFFLQIKSLKNTHISFENYKSKETKQRA